MRRATLAFVALLALAALTLPAAASSGKHARKAANRCAKHTRCAQVHRLGTRPSHTERLLDLGQPPQEPGSGDPPPSDPVLAGFVSVGAKEFALTLSRPLVGKGSVRVELRNIGEDPHNLVVSPEGTHTPLASFSTIDPGTYERKTVALDPGRYQLWCSLEGHEAKGMSVTLRVQ
ncbi:MAG TPA: hypothetical protein VF072_03730 [Thermoleophilaceae bacterium]